MTGSFNHHPFINTMYDHSLMLCVTPGYTVMGISTISKENLVPISDEYVDKIQLDEVGELEMTIEETTVTEHDSSRPLIPIGPSIKPWRPFILENPETSSVLLNNTSSQSEVPPSPSVNSWRPLLNNPQSSSVPSNNTFANLVYQSTIEALSTF